MVLYENVVGAVRAAHGFAIGDDEGFAVHLQTLVPSLHALRIGYRSGWGSVTVDYSQGTTEAYLLAYYPHYVGMAWAVLKFLPAQVWPPGDAVRVCLFGTGPSPEPVAIARYIGNNLPDVSILELHLFDIEPEAWQWAQNVSLQRILPRYWPGKVDVRAVQQADIGGSGLVSGAAANALAVADLVVFQNCLNELSPDSSDIRQNVRQLIDAMKPGAILTMTDIDNHPTARRNLEIVEETTSGAVAWLHRSDESLRLEVAPGLPDIVRRNLFQDGEYPRTKAFPWRCLAAQRR